MSFDCIWCETEVTDCEYYESTEPVICEGKIFRKKIERIVFLPCNHAFDSEAFKTYGHQVDKYNQGLITGEELKESLDNCLETVQTCQ